LSIIESFTFGLRSSSARTIWPPASSRRVATSLPLAPRANAVRAPSTRTTLRRGMGKPPVGAKSGSLTDTDRMPNDPHLLASLEQVRAIIGPENPVIKSKFYPALEETSTRFIRHSPLLLLSTVDRAGHPDVSPKGDGPGFVAIEDDRTLLIPERKGNKLIQGLQNILATGRVALVFLVPGTEETLRVHGRAELTADPAVLARLEERGQPALLAIRVHVEQAFFHCAKA